MTNHPPILTSSSATGSFSEFADTTNSTAPHQLSGTMNFSDSDHGDTHTTTATLHSAVLSSGSVIPAASLAHFNAAMTSQILSDHNGSGTLKWSFNDEDEDFDFLSKNQTLVLTYDILVSDNHGGTAKQTVTVTITGTDDRPVIDAAPVTTVTEQPNQTLSFSPDTAHIALNFTDADLTNTGHTANVIAASAAGVTSGILPGALGTAELMSFFHIDSVVKASGSSSGTINTTFSAPDLAFDYLAQGEHLTITYVVQLDDHAGGVTTQNVAVTVIGTNDKPVYLSGPETAHLIEGQDVSPAGNLTAKGDLAFTDVDLSDTHTLSTSVSASVSGGGAIPLSNAALLAAFTTSVEDSTHHLFGEVDWNFALPNNMTNFLGAGQVLKLTYHVTVTDNAGGSAVQDVTVTILGTNHPVVIASGPESASTAELPDTTGSTAIDTTTTVPAGTLAFTDADTGDTHTVATSLASTSWSGGSTIPVATQADLATALATTLHDSTGTGTGSVDWNFGLADKDFDFLAAGETLTVKYDVKVSDASTTATQTVSVTVTGANDAPVITSGPESASVAEQPNVTGSSALDTTGSVPANTLAFTDVDLSNTHQVSVTLDSAVWSANPSFIPSGTLADLQTALTTALHDSTGHGTGSVDWTFAIPDRDLDFLSPGETLTATYDVTVSDGIASSTQQVTITATGAEDPLVVNPVAVAVADTVNVDAGNIVAAGNVITDVFDGTGDLSSTLSVTAVNGQAAEVGTQIADTYGTLFIESDGLYRYTANAALDQLLVGDHPIEHFNITVSSSLGQSEVTTLTLNFSGADDAPVITAADATGTMTENLGPTLINNGGFETGDLTGWSASSPAILAEFLGLGGQFGNFAADLGPTSSVESLSQSVSTTPGQHYTVSFYVLGDTEATSNQLNVTWDGATLLAQSDNFGGLTRYSFDVVGDPSSSTTPLVFSYHDDGNGLLLDQVSVNPATNPPTESADGKISFTDAEAADTHTSSFAPQGSDYVGTFSLDPVTETPGNGSVAWHFTVDNSAIQFLAQGQVLTQDYLVSVTDSHGAATTQDVTITINGTNEPPTAVGENVVTDVDANGTVDIPSWALAANDTDPDLTDHLFANNIVSSSGGSAVQSGGDVFFTDDATLGGSFDYTTSDGLATSNAATAAVINNAASATSLTGASGDNILIATNGGEALTGGTGNDVLIGNSGSHVMTGGGGNDTFAFLHTTDGPATITDFNNTTAHDRIAVSASGFGGGLTAGMDVTALFESSNDNLFSGGGAEFHFDTANQTLYFSPDGTTASAIELAQVQPGVTIHPHDLWIV
jgi:VCBS repeat-containing protein